MKTEKRENKISGGGKVVVDTGGPIVNAGSDLKYFCICTFM